MRGSIRSGSAVLGVVLTLWVGAEAAQAQPFAVGTLDASGTLGVGDLRGAPLAIGVRVERGTWSAEDFGGGVVGLQLSLDRYARTSGGRRVRTVPVGLTAHYHFLFGDGRLDPYVGLGMGYRIVACTALAPDPLPCRNNALHFIGRVGIRAFTSSRIALFADVGAGASTLAAGATVRILR